MKAIFAPLLAGATCLAFSAQADVVLTDDHIFKNDICVGSLQCVDGETFGDIDLKVKSFLPQILLDDVSTTGHSWQISGDHGDLSFPEAFSIRRFPGGNFPFGISPAAAETTLWLGNSNSVGIGTNIPTKNLHIADFGTVAIRLESFTQGAGDWLIQENLGEFSIRRNNGGVPFSIGRNAPDESLTINDVNGYLGIGTSRPDAPLEVYTSDSFNFFRLTAQGANINKSVDITFTNGPLGTGQLRYNIVDGDNQEMSLDADGNMVLDGTLTTAGPTCAAGCDRVFDADYPLPSITEHADQMFSAGYLPSIGATVPNAPVNLSERQGNIINSLEHAHIYIQDLNTQLQVERARNDQLATQLELVMKHVNLK